MSGTDSAFFLLATLQDDPSGPSLAQALAPLDDEQTALNHRREMLYFRMETNIHPVQQPVLTRGYGAMP